LKNISIFFKAFIEFGNFSALDAAAATAVLCLKDGSTYCYINIVNTFSSITGANATTLVNLLCPTRCYFRLLALGIGLTQNLTERAILAKDLNLFDGLCTTNDGQYCINIFENAVPQFIADVILNCANATAGTCPSNCKGYLVNDLINPMGCCFQTFANSGFLNLTAFTSAFSSCSITLVPACPHAATVSGKLRIANLAWTYVSSSSAQVLQDYYYDLASYFGINPSRITGAVSQQSSSSVITTSSSMKYQSNHGILSTTVTVTGGTDFTFSVTTDTTTQSTNMQNAYNADLQANTVILPIIGSYPIESRLVPVAGISVDSTASTVSVTIIPSGSSGGAYIISPNSLMILMSAIASFMLFHL